MYVNTHPQCSPASVGLAQAHPNYINQQLPHQLGSLKQCHLQSFWHSEISSDNTFDPLTQIMDVYFYLVLHLRLIQRRSDMVELYYPRCSN